MLLVFLLQATERFAIWWQDIAIRKSEREGPQGCWCPQGAGHTRRRWAGGKITQYKYQCIIGQQQSREMVATRAIPPRRRQSLYLPRLVTSKASAAEPAQRTRDGNLELARQEERAIDGLRVPLKVGAKAVEGAVFNHLGVLLAGKRK